METQKLEKSATVTRTSFWQRNGLPILVIVAALSLFANLMLYVWGAQADRSASRYFDRFLDLGEENRVLEDKNAGLLHDIKEMTTAAVPPGLENKAAVDIYTLCLMDPSGLTFSWWNLARDHGRGGIVDFRIHNMEPIANASGSVFRFGESCHPGGLATVRIAETRLDGYLLVLQDQRDEADRNDAGACPDGVYRFASRENEVLHSAVTEGCLARAKVTEYAHIPATR